MDNNKVHIHSHGLDYSSREEVVLATGGADGGGDFGVAPTASTTKILWAELNAQSALPQFATPANSTTHFAAQHANRSKRWQRLRHKGAANEYELAYNHGDVSRGFL